MFTISIQLVEGKQMYCVHRVDGRSFHDGVVSYNFDLEDYALAEACLSALNVSGGEL